MGVTNGRFRGEKRIFQAETLILPRFLRILFGMPSEWVRNALPETVETKRPQWGVKEEPKIANRSPDRCTAINSTYNENTLRTLVQALIFNKTP